MLPTNKGAHFEKLACQYLRKQGYHEITCNYRCRFGKIDLIMGNRHQLVFVEVKYRSHGSWGDAVEAVGHHKQNRLRLAARHFLLCHPRLQYMQCRFDVLGISRNSAGICLYKWIPDAFI